MVLDPKSGEAGRPRRQRKVRSPLPGCPDLMTHRDVAAKIGLPVETLREWVEKGSFPLPHAAIRSTMFYRVDMVAGWLETGHWPEGAKFNRFVPGGDEG
jgi:hypothetical protein